MTPKDNNTTITSSPDVTSPVNSGGDPCSTTEWETNDSDVVYGCFKWRPRCLQVFSSSKWLVTFLCVANFSMSMVTGGLLPTVIGTLEKRFQLTSTQTGVISTSYDMGTVPALVVVAFIGRRFNRPRCIATGLALSALATFAFALGHFTTGRYVSTAAASIRENLCVLNSTLVDQGCSSDATQSVYSSTGLSNYFYLFLVSYFLVGIGSTPIYTVGVTFMDDCLSKENVSFCLALFYATGVLGPATAYIMQAVLVEEVYIDADVLGTESLSQDKGSNSWLGAWWIGYIIAASLIALMVLPIGGLPQDMPGAKKIREAKMSEAHTKADDGVDDSISTTPTDFETEVTPKQCCQSIKTLLANPVYMFITANGICEQFVVTGFTYFGPKYISEQFLASEGLAGSLWGAVAIPGAVGGTVAGGLIIKRFRMMCTSVLKLNCFLALASLLFVPVFLLQCPNLDVAGLTTGYRNRSSDGFTSICNAGCGCSELLYRPVCGSDHVTYYSPCHAGCQHWGTLDGSKMYSNCSCMREDTLENATATENPCTGQCSLAHLSGFLVIALILMALIFASIMCAVTGTLRSIPSLERSKAISIQWIMLRCFAFVPGGIAFGHIFDRTCLLWQTTCDESTTSACLFYDNWLLGTHMMIVYGVLKTASLLFATLAWKLYKPPQVLDVNDNDKPEEKGHVASTHL